MSRRAALFALICALVGLGAVGRRRLRALPPALRSDLSQLLRRQRDDQLHAGLREPVQHVPAASRSPSSARIWFVARGAAVGRRALTARPAVRESVPGYLFALSTLAARRHPVSRLRVVRPAESRLRAVPDHVCRRDRALPRVRRGHVVSHDFIASPRRSHDLQVLVDQPAGHHRRRAVLRPAPHRRLRSSRAKARRRHRRRAVDRCRRPRQDQRSEFERWYRRRSRACRWWSRPTARRCSIVKFNDFQCPACGQSYLQYKPIFAKYEAEHPGAVKLVLKDYPLNRDCNDAIGQIAPSGRVRGRRRRAAGRGRTTRPKRWKSGCTRTSRR